MPNGGSSHALLSFAICGAASVLEGAAAGGDVRARYAELRLPPFSPPFPLWIAIGLAYYTMCFVVLWRLLSLDPGLARTIALALIVTIMMINAAWGLLFFRLRDFRASYLAFFPYGALVVALTLLLARIDVGGAFVVLPYALYLVYATWWGRAVWRLNDARGPRAPR